MQSSLVTKAVHVLNGIEDGNMHSSDAYNAIKDFDPVLIYFMFRYLREKYPATTQASQGVMERLVELTSTYPDLVKASQKGEKDILKEWFDENYAVKEYHHDADGYVQLIFDKLEG